MLKIVVITAEHQACCDLNLIPQHGQQETQSVSTRRFWRCLERYGKASATGCAARKPSDRFDNDRVDKNKIRNFCSRIQEL